MKLWIDDERTPPPGWAWATTSAMAIAILDEWDIDEVSFDHDLGGDDTTRRVVYMMASGELDWPAVIHVHTANQVGRVWLEGTIERYGPGVTK